MKALVLALGLAMFAAGCEKECLIQPGAYAMSLTPKTGDCPDNIISQFSSYSDQVTIPAQTACTKFLTNIESKADNCDLIMEVSANADATGLSDGEGVFRVKCDDDFSCRHEFAVGFEAVKAP